ncbi:MAG: phage tail sheath family protein [Solirubrobacteraceae bacterium]
MPVAPTYPGVYVEEVPSGVRTIVGVATSITAFVGFARRGQIDDPVRIQSWGEYERMFGGLWEPSTMSYAVQQYFANGGADAIIVRVAPRTPARAASTAVLTIGADTAALTLEAASPGSWANGIRVRIDHHTREPGPGEREDELFNVSAYESDSGAREEFRNVSAVAEHARFVQRVLEQQSDLLRAASVGSERPDPHADPDAGVDALERGDPATHFNEFPVADADGAGTDGAHQASDLEGSEAGKTGIFALLDADIFNLLCVPPVTREAGLRPEFVASAARLCAEQRALLLVDSPPGWTDVAAARAGIDGDGSGDFAIADRRNAAMYFPWIEAPDPLREGANETFPPCGAVAGVIARTDAERGVWKAPAGQDATLAAVSGLSVALTDGENGQLNPLGLNCLRTLPGAGHIVWGARTLDGADRNASEWKYLPIRRLALYIEESLYRGTRWAVFEPNDEPLWSQLRLNVGTFMHDLFRQGAFQGANAREAYFVKCDSETTTQSDRNRGIVNVLIGFAPLKPAEFVILKIGQIAGTPQL